MTACGLHCLKIKNISVTASGQSLLRNVSLHVHCGELTVIIGRNGAGKSTLLKAILGEIPHTGQVEFSGHCEGDCKTEQLRIGYVPQSLELDSGSPATVYDMLASLSTKWPVFLPRPARIMRRFREHLAEFDAADLLDKKLGHLSGGELQRVLLAAAMLPRPDLLILDEPVSGVDRAGLSLFYQVLDRLKQSSDMVMLLVSHDLEFVRTYADRVLLLDCGVAAMGTPAEVFSHHAFRRAFPAAAEGGNHP